jgi:hypothetical protein
LINEHWSLIFAKNSEPSLKALQSGDFKSASFTECIDRISATTQHKIAPVDRDFLLKLNATRNKAVHAGSVEISIAREYVAQVVRFVLSRYFEEYIPLHFLTHDEDSILSRIRITATEFTEYNDKLDRESAQLLIETRKNEFLWVCTFCGTQSVRVGQVLTECLRCSHKTPDVSNIVDETIPCMPLEYGGKLFEAIGENAV